MNPRELLDHISHLPHARATFKQLVRELGAKAETRDQLEAALRQFGGARIALYDSMTQGAAGQEKQISDLQATVKAHKAPVEEHKAAPAAVPCTPPPKPAVKKKHVTPKPTQPATGQPPTGQPAKGQPPQTPPGQPKP